MMIVPCPLALFDFTAVRSEERRGGEEGRSRGWPYHLKKKKIGIHSGDALLPNPDDLDRSRHPQDVNHASQKSAPPGPRAARVHALRTAITPAHTSPARPS